MKDDTDKRREKKTNDGGNSLFFKEEYELDLGLIGQEAVLDFFLEYLGKPVYDIALDDAKRFYDRQRDNMEADFYMLYQDRMR